ncbi:MAG TPA: hypothetical protein PLS26_07265 [Bacteroidales bacterium]|nr:hypothetical protein [Bacteroidales bacterium]
MQLAKTKQLKEHIIANQQATEQLLKALLHGAFLPAEEAAPAGVVEEKENNTDLAMAAEKEEKYNKSTHINEKICNLKHFATYRGLRPFKCSN